LLLQLTETTIFQSNNSPIFFSMSKTTIYTGLFS
jgi:hypothetical protein